MLGVELMPLKETNEKSIDYSSDDYLLLLKQGYFIRPHFYFSHYGCDVFGNVIEIATGRLLFHDNGNVRLTISKMDRYYTMGYKRFCVECFFGEGWDYRRNKKFLDVALPFLASPASKYKKKKQPRNNRKINHLKHHPLYRNYAIDVSGKIINTSTGRQIAGRKGGKNKGYMRVSCMGKQYEIYENKFVVECLLGEVINGRNYEDYVKSVCKWYDYQKVSYRQLSPYRIRWDRQDGTTVFFANSEQLRKATGIILYNCITKTTRNKTIKSVRNTPHGVESYTIVVERRFL